MKKDKTEPTTIIRSTAELAAHLGLSRWTVSRVLNGHPGIGKATRKRVEEAMSRFQFAPSPMARALRGGRTGTVGICLQELELFNLTSKISTMHSLLREQGFRVLLEFSVGRQEAEAEILHHFIAMQVEGVVIFSGLLSRRSPVLRALEDAGIPVIMVDPHTPSFRETVWIDRAAAIRKVAQHLVQLGHRRFAALGIHPTSYYGTVRSQALQEYLAPPHAPADTQLLYLYEPEAQRMDFEYGRRLAERLLALPEPPTALIALSDRLAFGAMEYLKRCGYQIPQDFSITGYDNSELSAFAVPALTTVDPHVDRLIDQAVKLLLENIEKKKAVSTQTQRIEPDLVLRSSTAPPPAKPVRTTPLETL